MSLNHLIVMLFTGWVFGIMFLPVNKIIITKGRIDDIMVEAFCFGAIPPGLFVVFRSAIKEFEAFLNNAHVNISKTASVILYIAAFIFGIIVSVFIVEALKKGRNKKQRK